LVLSFAGRRLGAERVASLVTMRETPENGVRFEGIRRIELGGLSTPDAHELLAAAAVGPIDEIVANHIVAATHGNPLALVELPTVLTVEQLRGTAPLPDPLPIGERLSGLFAARVRALDAGARTVLLLASAERLGDPRLLRRAADAVGHLSWHDAVATAEASGLAPPLAQQLSVTTAGLPTTAVTGQLALPAGALIEAGAAGAIATGRRRNVKPIEIALSEPALVA
jgi:hypothetical protein